MANFTNPGIYRQDVSLLGQPVTAANTSTVAFIGNTGAGPVAQPVLVNSFTEYQSQFQSAADPVQNSADSPDAMTQALMAFYGNGGKKAYICRLTSADYQAFYQTVLLNYHDFSLIVLPGQHWDIATGNTAITATLAFCQQHKQCLLLMDVAASQPLTGAASVAALALPTSSYAALYYPWLKMVNPLYHAVNNPTAAKLLSIAPSAVAAAVYTRTDSSFGVWKTPAGVSAKIIGVSGLAYSVDELSQQQLNPLGINCIRTLPRVGTVLWGARTLATQADPEWRYISVRRTAIFIEQSIRQSLGWAVFEPNEQPLWQAVRRNISNFLNTLFRAGAMQGQTAKEAFFVRCGLNDSMTQHDITKQQLVVELGFAPLKPAEFVVIRIVHPLTPP
ncbi:phage tail sheath family protein [Arsukibacterium ikkense]|uniref:phage tail sheath family protein n=1 Tax=Arsukibacterium ikkense TaxID=336831 RepID=UPI000A07A979|nr:phage tail sheath C-terminal domain-containing protein [Arsukibacterium ikkense]